MAGNRCNAISFDENGRNSKNKRVRNKLHYERTEEPQRLWRRQDAFLQLVKN